MPEFSSPAIRSSDIFEKMNINVLSKIIEHITIKLHMPISSIYVKIVRNMVYGAC